MVGEGEEGAKWRACVGIHMEGPAQRPWQQCAWCPINEGNKG